eukprot:4626817-Pyramimonas_sp.AAC.1
MGRGKTNTPQKYRNIWGSLLLVSTRLCVPGRLQWMRPGPVHAFRFSSVGGWKEREAVVRPKPVQGG